MRIRKTLSLLLALIVIAGLFAALPVAALAEGTTTVSLGAGALNKNDRLWFASYGDSQVEWRVLSTATDNTLPVSGIGEVLLISNRVLTKDVCIKADKSSKEWAGSDAQAWCTQYYNSNQLAEPEKDAVRATSVTETNDKTYLGNGYYYHVNESDKYYLAASLSNERFFFLSAEEADKFFSNNNDRKALNYDSSASLWLLRSPRYAGDYIGQVQSDGEVGLGTMDYKCGARPAFNLNLSSVLLASTSSSNQYKLTLIDSAMNVSEGTVCISRSGNTVTVPYTVSGDNAGNADQVALLITGKDDTWTAGTGWSSGAAIQYYETQTVTAGGSATFNLPDSLADKVCGTDYAAYLLAVDENGEHESDYASAPVAVTLPDSTTYPLWIGGTRVTENNRNKLSDNHWSYDPASHTLTLSGYSYSGQGYNYSGSYYAGIYYNGADALTISLINSNSVTQTKGRGDPGDCPIVIDSTTALTVAGSGSLTVQQGDTWNYGPAILSSGPITLSGGTVNAVGAYYNGIKAPSVTVKSTVTSVDVKGCGDSAKAVDGTLINEIGGVGYNQWNQPTKIEANTAGAVLTYKQVVFPIAEYTLQFDANGGGGSMDDVTVEEGESYTLPACGFTPPEDKKFNYWEVQGMDLIGIPGTPAVIASNCADEDGIVQVKAKWIDADKAPAATVKTAPEAEDLTYSGQSQTLVTAGEAEGGAMWYAIGENATDAPDSGWSKDIPLGTNAGPYYVWYKAVGDNSHRDSEAACCEAKIAQATVTAPTIASKTYNAQTQTADVTASTLYSVTKNNGGTNAGNYDVELTLDDAANYKWTDSEDAAKTLTFTITQATAPAVVTPTPEAVTYDPNKTLESVALPNGWAWVAKDTVPTVNNNGYAAAYTVPDDKNYDYTNVEGYDTQAHKVTRTVALTVNKAESTPAAVTANNRTYDGTEKPLVTAGTATGGEMQYALGTKDAATEPYTISIPTATDAGTYYVWYKVTGDANHNSTEAASVTATINPVDKAKLETAIKAAETYYDSIKDNAIFAGIAETLKKAIDTAKAAVDNKNVTASEVETQITAVGTAVENAKKEAETVSKEVADKAAAKAVTDLINALPASVTAADKDAVAAARKAYDALSDDQKKLVAAETLSKLTTAEDKVKGAEADAAAVKTVTDAISALPASVTAADKDAVTAARKAYDALTEDQKKLVAAETLSKLTTAEAQVKAAEEAAAAEAEKKTADEAAAKTVTDLINALPAEAGVKDKDTVAAARKAYDALTEEQKKLVSEETLAKLTAAEAAIAAAEKDAAAAKTVTDLINALPEKIDLSDKDAVAAARKAYDALTDAQKALVPADTLKKLTDAEAAIAAAETISLRKCTITAKPRIYTGNAIVPKVTVMYGETRLKEGRDYTLTYSKAKIYQKVKVTVKGKGKFKGSRNVYFKIIPKGTEITKVTGGTKQFTVEWKKREGVTGYRIEYSLHEDFSKSRGLYVKGVDNLTATIRKPKAGRTYYVRVRTYVKRKNRLFFSAWSETVSTNRAKANETQVFEATMNVGEELDLNALVPGVADWESSDDLIATVSTEGIVKALAAGEAVITATDANGEQIRIVITISNENVIELDEIELDDLDLTDFEGGIVEDFVTDEEIQMDEELELVLG